MPALECFVRQTLVGQEVINSFHYSGPDAVPANGQAIADFLADAWDTTLKAALAPQWQFDEVSVREVGAGETPVFNYTPSGGAFVGTNAGLVLPPQLAIMVLFDANTARPNRGRRYLGGWTSSHLATGNITTAALTQAGLWADFILDPMGEAALDMALQVRRYTAYPGGFVENPVAGYRLTNVWSTLGRRRVGRGS